MLLTRVIPLDHPEIASWVGIIQNDGQDGYKLLWRILAISLPGFSSTVVPIFPQWSDVRDVTLFAKLVTLHFQLIAKKGNFSTEKEKSLLFLHGIQEVTLQGTISSLVTAVESHVNAEFDDDYLPEKMMIVHLAQRITLDYAGLQGDSHHGRRIHQATMDEEYYEEAAEVDHYPMAYALDQRRPPSRQQYPLRNSQNWSVIFGFLTWYFRVGPHTKSYIHHFPKFLNGIIIISDQSFFSFAINKIIFSGFSSIILFFAISVRSVIFRDLFLVEDSIVAGRI